MTRVSSYGPPVPAGGSGSGNAWKWALGCAALAAVCTGVAFVALIALAIFFGRDPEGVVVNMDYPREVVVGEPFDVVMELRNIGDEDVEIGDLDLDQVLGGSFLDGCDVVSTSPSMEMDASVPGFKSFHYNAILAAGETHTVRFTVEAREPGNWGGTVGINVGHLLLEDRVNLVAVEAGQSGPVEKPPDYSGQ